MLIHPEKLSLTTSSGSASGNTQKIIGIVRQILISPATANTSYTMTITNPSGIEVYERTAETGEASELTAIPVTGIYTVALSDATNDELFEIELLIEEQQ